MVNVSVLNPDGQRVDRPSAFAYTFPVPDPSPSGKHANYLSVVTRPDLFKAYSLRPNPLITDKANPDYGKQLLGKKLGGYAEVDTVYDTTYDDSTPWDAARLRIPVFNTGGPALAKPIGPDDTVLYFAAKFSDMKATRRFMIDDEMVESTVSVTDLTTLAMGVKRGVGGTIAAAHAAGAVCRFNANSAYNNIRLPLGTQDGHRYIFRIDTLHTESYVQMNDPGLHTLTNHKWLNYISDGIWLEPDAQYSGGTGSADAPGFNKLTDVAAFQIRSYNALGGKADFSANPVYAKGYLGPGGTDNEPLEPQLSPFIIKPNRVIRHWMVLDQRAANYSLVSYAIADETTGIIWTHRDVQVTVRQSVKSVQELVLESNTSTYAYSHNRPLESFSADMACWKDPVGDTSDIFTPPTNTEWAR